MRKPPNPANDFIRTGQIWLPIVSGASLAFLAVVLWQLLLGEERAHVQQTVAGQAQQVAGLIKENLEGRIPALKRMARRWEMRDGIPRQEWEVDAANFIQDNPDVLALEWVDPEFHVRWVVPMKGNEEAQDLHLGFEQHRREALEASKTGRTVTITQPIDLVQGGKGFLVYLPIFVKDEFQGFTLAVFRFQEWLDVLLADVRTSHYSLQLFKNGEEIYARQKPAVQYDAETAQDAEVSVYGLTWRVRACPTPELIARSTTWLPEISLAIGLILALLIAFTVHLSQIATSRAKFLQKANQDLRKEKAERRPIENALRLTQFSLDRAGDSVFWIGPDSHFYYVNDAACQGLGYAHDELLSMAVEDIDPESTTEVWPDFWQKLKEQKVLHYESRHKRKDGSVSPVEITANFLEFEGKEYDFAAVRNISERKRAEAALRESEDWFKTISEAIPHLVWTANPDGALDYVNHRATEYFARSLEQMIGWNWTEVLHPDDLPKCLERWAQAREQGIPYEIEFRLQRASDQSYRWFLARALPFKNQEGQIIKWFGTSTDITDRKIAEEALRQIHGELEERVTLRTAELVSANAHLESEIAERSQMEKLLRESEARLKAVLDNSPSLIFIKDLQGRYLHTNPQFERVFRLAKGQALEKTDKDLFPPAQAAQFWENDQVVIQQQAPVNFEEVAEQEDGPHTSVVSKFPLFDVKGEIYGICGIALDITERTRAEERLKASQARLQTIFNSAPIGMTLVDMEGRITESNPALQEFLGYGGDELRGNRFAEFTHPDEVTRNMEQFRDFVSGNSNEFQTEKRYLRSDGKVVWGQVSVSVIRDSRSGPAYAIAMLENIHERKQAEAALTESEERWQLALEGSRDGVWDWNILTDQVFYSTRWKAIFGFEEHEVPHHVTSFSKRVHPDDIAGVWEEVDRYFRGEISTYQREFRMFHRDGSIVWVLNRGVVVFDEHHKPIRMLGTIVDITQQKRLEEDIRKLNASLEERVQERTSELELKNAELERFTYAVSHDLKSPLVTIQGFLKVLDEDAHAGRTARLNEDIQRIQGAAQKMQQLLNDVLELSRVGRIVSLPEPVEMGEVIREAVEQVTGQTSPGGIQVDLAPEWPIVIGDRPRLVEVVQNLVDNAAKFMGTQPKPRIEIGVRQEAEETVMFVRDNGIGIEPRFQKKIFGLFERLDARAEGTGVGLALVKRIIEVQGGRIWVESAGQGHGCTICFTLPCKGIMASKSQVG